MNSRQRIMCALEHKKPDRTPVDLGSTNVTSIHVNAYKKLIDKLGITDSEIQFLDYPLQLVVPCDELLLRLQIDTRGVGLGVATRNITVNLTPDKFIDAWGLQWERTEKGLYFDSVNYPLQDAQTIADIDRYKFPAIENLASDTCVRKKVKRLYEETPYAIVGSFGSSIFMRAQLLRGYTQLFIDMIEDPEMVHHLMDIILDIRINLATMLLDNCGEYLNVIEMADDVAGQDSPMMSMDMYREFIKPKTKKLIDFIKSRSDAKIMYHCCGNMTDFIDDFVEMGVDILNPVQVSANKMGDTKQLKERYGKNVCFWGGVDAQRVLIVPNPEKTANEARRRIDDLGGGGYVLCASHNIQSDVEPENILAMYDTATKVT